jgi:hypothetical protein
VGTWQRPTRVAALTFTAAALIGLVLAGCTNSRTGSRAEGSVSGRAILAGRLPGDGRPFTIGAVRDGKIVRTAAVRRVSAGCLRPCVQEPAR